MKKLFALLILATLFLVSCKQAPEPKKKVKYDLVLKKTSDINVSALQKRPVNILLLGSDSRKESFKGRADAIMVVRIDPSAKTIKMVSFPRDSIVSIPGRGQTKINAAYFFGGADLMKRTVEGYGGIKIDYFAATNFEGFVRILKTVPAIEVDLERPMKDSAAWISLPAGKNRLSPQDALGFCRSRKVVAGGDFGRAANQQKLLANFHAQQGGVDIGFVLQRLPTILTNMQSNVPLTEALTLVQMAQEVPAANVTRTVLPGGTGNFNGASSVLLNRSAANRIFSEFK